MSVTQLQTNLSAAGFDPGAIDGALGALTYQALAGYLTGGKAPKGTGALVALNAAAGQLTNRLRLIHFFAQVSYESGFRPVAENLNYSVAGLLSTFGPQRITAAQAQAVGRAPGRPADQQAIANIVYGGAWGAAHLGNDQPGDGYRFRGRGLIQLTGRANYSRTGPEFEVNPEIVLTPAGSVKAAVDFWLTRNINPAADQDDTSAVTELVNGGDKGLAGRQALTDKAKAIWPA